jgi:hypothetical protein
MRIVQQIAPIDRNYCVKFEGARWWVYVDGEYAACSKTSEAEALGNASRKLLKAACTDAMKDLTLCSRSLEEDEGGGRVCYLQEYPWANVFVPRHVEFRWRTVFGLLKKVLMQYFMRSLKVEKKLRVITYTDDFEHEIQRLNDRAGDYLAVHGMSDSLVSAYIDHKFSLKSYFYLAHFDVLTSEALLVAHSERFTVWSTLTSYLQDVFYFWDDHGYVRNGYPALKAGSKPVIRLEFAAPMGNYRAMIRVRTCDEDPYVLEVCGLPEKTSQGLTISRYTISQSSVENGAPQAVSTPSGAELLVRFFKLVRREARKGSNYQSVENADVTKIVLTNLLNASTQLNSLLG